MPDFMPENCAYLAPELAQALNPVLLSHRDMMYKRHIGLSLDL